MKQLGFVLISIAFLAGAFVVVRPGDVHYASWACSMALGVVGVLLARMGGKAESTNAEIVSAGRESLGSSLAALLSGLKDINDRRDAIGVYGLSAEIDRLLAPELERFAAARETLIPVFGLGFYADLMSHFAAGERYVNRVWCCSTDGYIDEAFTYLERAIGEFSAVSELLNAADSREERLEERRN